MRFSEFKLITDNDSSPARFGVWAGERQIIELDERVQGRLINYLHKPSPKLSVIGALVQHHLNHASGRVLLGDVPRTFSTSQIRLQIPFQPTSLRDFYAFETHVKTASQNRGRDVPAEWYEFPVFYYNNPHTVYGHEDTIPHPSYSAALDYELEIACVIGTQGIDIKAEDAEKHIFGYMIFNDWSARDVQRKEMKVGLGPAKGKDFAKSFGPYLVTADELQDRHTGRPGVYDLEMVARVNGVERSRGNMKDLYWSFGQMIERASQDVMLYPGDVIGSGTVGTGCLLELTKGEGPWLQPGDVVELEIERLGVLQNTIGEKRSAKTL